MEQYTQKLCLVQEKPLKYEPKMTDIPQAAKMLRPLFENSPNEILFAVAVNNQNQITAVAELAKGTCDMVIFDQKDAMRLVLLSGGNGLIIAHNHPCGKMEASEADKHMTQTLKECCKLMNIRFLDSLILSHDEFYSIVNNVKGKI